MFTKFCDLFEWEKISQNVKERVGSSIETVSNHTCCRVGLMMFRRVRSASRNVMDPPIACFVLK